MSEKKANAARPRLSFGPRPFREIYDVGQKWLADRVQQAMQAADRELIELASSSTSNDLQNLYFEAVLTLRRDRAKAEAQWLTSWTALFEEAASTGGAAGQPEPDTEAELDASAFPDRSAYEEAVLINTLIKQANEASADKLHILTARLNAALEIESFNNTNNPFSPRSLIKACQSAFDLLELDPEVRSVLYREIDRLVFKNIAKLHSHCNLLLKKRGFLPELESAPVPRTTQQREPTQEPEPTQALGANQGAPVSADCATGGETFTMLRSLLHGGKADATNPETGSDSEIPTAELLELLTRWQNTIAAAPPVSGLQTQPKLAEQVRQKLGEHFAAKGLSASAVDQDTILVVSMLFEVILDDQQLATPIVMLLRALQIPMLRLALVERGVFSNRGHPARGLLNEISSACIGWMPDGEADKDPLYRHIAKTVETVLKAQQQRADLYNDLLQDFRDYNSRMQRKTALLQERLAGAEHARAMAEEARNVVNRAAQRRLDRNKVPRAASELIQGSVRRWLQWVYLREGAGSVDWKKSLAILDRFIDCFSGNDNESPEHSRARFSAAVSELSSALDIMGDDLMQVRAQLGEVQQSHEKLLKSSSPELGELRPSDATAAQPATKAALSTDESAPADDEDTPTPDREMLLRVDQLKAETWFQFNPDDGNPTRCKLAVILPSTGRYIFMNRLGHKVVEFTTNRLAWALSNGTLHLIEERQVFDRALESVIGRLQGQQAR